MRKTFLVSLLLLTFFSLWCVPTKKNKNTQEIRPYRLINADQLYLTKFDKELGTQLTGNVHFFYGTTEFFCDLAEFYDQQKYTRLFGKVHVIDDTLDLVCDEATYMQIDEILKLKDNIFIKETHKDKSYRTFSADYGEYNRKEQNLFASGVVKAYDQKQELHGECGYLTYSLKDSYGYLTQRPSLHITGKDTLHVESEKMELFYKDKKVVANFNVKSYNRQAKTHSDFLIYQSSIERAIYLGNPEFNSSFANAQSEKMTLYFKDNELNNIILEDSCRVHFSEKEDTLKNNWVNSDSMYVQYEQSNPKYFMASKKVDSSFETKGGKVSKDPMATTNKAEQLYITFLKDQKIDSIQLRNNVKGKYRFQTKTKVRRANE